MPMGGNWGNGCRAGRGGGGGKMSPIIGCHWSRRTCRPVRSRRPKAQVSGDRDLWHPLIGGLAAVAVMGRRFGPRAGDGSHQRYDALDRFAEDRVQERGFLRLSRGAGRGFHVDGLVILGGSAPRQLFLELVPHLLELILVAGGE